MTVKSTTVEIINSQIANSEINDNQIIVEDTVDGQTINS